MKCSRVLVFWEDCIFRWLLQWICGDIGWKMSYSVPPCRIPCEFLQVHCFPDYNLYVHCNGAGGEFMNCFQFSKKLKEIKHCLVGLKPTSSSKLQDLCFSYDSTVEAFGHQLWEGLPFRELTWVRDFKHRFRRLIVLIVSIGFVASSDLCDGCQLIHLLKPHFPWLTTRIYFTS